MVSSFLINEGGGGALEFSLVGFLAAFSILVIVVHFFS